MNPARNDGDDDDEEEEEEDDDEVDVREAKLLARHALEYESMSMRATWGHESMRA